MNDLLAEMASDSEATPDKIDQLQDGKLDIVSRLANEAATLERELADAEKLMKEKKSALHKITDEQLPEALEVMGLQKFTLVDGSEIAVKPIYAASIPKDRKEEAFQWLREKGYDDIIKNTVSVRFGRGEDELCERLKNLLSQENYPLEQADKVEPMTLKAFVKEQIERGNEMPLDLFGVYVGQRVKIKT